MIMESSTQRVIVSFMVLSSFSKLQLVGALTFSPFLSFLQRNREHSPPFTYLLPSNIDLITLRCCRMARNTPEVRRGAKRGLLLALTALPFLPRTVGSLRVIKPRRSIRYDTELTLNLSDSTQ